MSQNEALRGKSTVEEIRRRFDADVERFSNLETGQSATVDAPLVLDLVTRAAAAATPGAGRLLDVGCGAGNYSLKLLQLLPDLDVDLVDLSRPMLDRARARLGAVARGEVVAHQADIRKLPLEPGRYDLVVAAATLHHLRTEEEWEAVFAKLFAALRPGGSMWVSDMIEHSVPAVQALMWARYGEYLTELRDAAYREQVFAYIEKEDTPRPLLYQLDLMRAVGFRAVDVLHKNGSFAAYGGVR
jgi:tRNA (cmo5U34)-methyltransferase